NTTVILSNSEESPKLTKTTVRIVSLAPLLPFRHPLPKGAREKYTVILNDSEESHYLTRL
ncbi:MAG: hypothetical protein SPL76_02065, partial [Cyanobacteriota bacterium]|nr:hypothetical protein [Cyanobacteriota bacterium]